MSERHIRSVLRRSGLIRYHHLATVTVAGTYILMTLGAYTSAIGAGLSCPDWPTCYGTIVPFLHPDIIANSPYSGLQIFAEWAHRGLALVVGILIVSTALTAWTSYERRLVVGPAVVAALLLPVQVLLGGLTVTESLEPVIVTSHLATAILITILLTVSASGSWMLNSQRLAETARSSRD